MTVDDLGHLTRTGRPVLCPVAKFGGHWVVVRGVERGRVHYHCPADGPGSERSAVWLYHWHDTARSGCEFVRWGIAPAKGSPCT